MIVSSTYVVQVYGGPGWVDAYPALTYEDAIARFDQMVEAITDNVPGKYDGKLRVIRRTVSHEVVANLQRTMIFPDDVEAEQ